MWVAGDGPTHEDQAVIPTDPPLLSHLLLEKPLLLIVLFLIAAVVMLFVAVQRNSRTVLLTAAGLAVAAGGVWILAHFIQTQRERLIGQTQQLVDAVAAVEEDQLRLLLGPRVFVSIQDGSPWLHVDQIVPKIEWTHKRYPIQNHRISRITAEQRNDQHGLVLVNVKMTIGPTAQPIHTQWLITWTREGDDPWRVTQIQWLKLNGIDVTRAVLP